jgi:hypothetical protein
MKKHFDYQVTCRQKGLAPSVTFRISGEAYRILCRESKYLKTSKPSLILYALEKTYNNGTPTCPSALRSMVKRESCTTDTSMAELVTEAVLEAFDKDYIKKKKSVTASPKKEKAMSVEDYANKIKNFYQEAADTLWLSPDTPEDLTFVLGHYIASKVPIPPELIKAAIDYSEALELTLTMIISQRQNATIESKSGHEKAAA